MTTTIWHNPRCSKSRQALALLKEKGVEPMVRKYLDEVPSVAELKTALAQLGLEARGMMRTKEAVYKTLGLAELTDTEALIEAMSETPKLIERPIVFRNGKAVIGRPTEAILALLED